MLALRIQELMIQGHALSNKFYFGQWNQGEFEAWVEACYSLISACKPEPYFPCFPDHRHIEEIVFLLQKVLGEISRGQIEYMGIF